MIERYRSLNSSHVDITSLDCANALYKGSAAGHFANMKYLFATLVAVSYFAYSDVAQADVILKQVSSDPFTNTTSQHRTQAEPDTFGFSDNILAVFQSGRFKSDGGSSGISFSFTSDGGLTWSSGNLPNITKFQGGVWDRVSDPSVTFSAKHNVWLASTLAIDEEQFGGAALLISRSSNGTTWSNPIIALSADEVYDKNWIVCDNTVSSPFFGRCYLLWSSSNTLLKVSVSNNGGLGWTPAAAVSGSTSGTGVQPVVTPSGVVVVVYKGSFSGDQVFVTRSFTGGSFTPPVLLSDPSRFPNKAGLRDNNLPSVEVDALGRVYAVWASCDFRSQSDCINGGADIVMRRSLPNAVAWEPLRRVTFTPGDHFIPGIGVDNRA